MNTMIRAGGRHWSLPLALLPMTLVAVPARAQSEAAVVRTVSTWQQDVDRLRQELQSQRKMELEFRRSLGTLQARLQVVAADSERVDLQAQSQLMFAKLREASAAQFRVRREIEKLCAAVQQPDGYIGVATTGVSVLDRQVDGATIVRFLERPIVESVDPGSPADRVGLKSGDVLLEIGGKTLLHNNVVFAELLRPGERVAVKLQRGGEVMTLVPVVETAPQAPGATPCSWVDAGTAYVVAPMPAAQGFRYEVRSGGAAAPQAVRMRDSTGKAAPSVVFAGPVPSMYGGGGSLLAGLHLVALNQESSRPLGASFGLFVNEVAPGTPGREAGLQGGDVLVSADSVELRSVSALQRVIRLSRDRTVTIVIMRDKKRETVMLRW